MMVLRINSGHWYLSLAVLLSEFPSLPHLSPPKVLKNPLWSRHTESRAEWVTKMERKNGVQLKRELTSSWSTKRRNYIENLVEILRIAIDCGRGKESRYRGPCSVSLTWEGKNSQWTIVMNFYPSGSTCWAKKFCPLTGWIESMAAMRRTLSTYLPAKATRPSSTNRSRSPFF